MTSRLFATGIGAPEGPICLPDGSMYVTEMSAATLCVTHLDPQGKRKVIKKTAGRPNGLAPDGNGRIWIAEAGLRALICIDGQGNEIRRMEGDGAVRFLFPNDLCFGPNGLLYMTDSGLAATDFINGQEFVEGYMDLDWDGRVYEIDPVAMKVRRVLDRKIRFTNGIAFGADNQLYANASFTGEIYRYDVLRESAPVRIMFGNVLQPDSNPDFKGPDGMAFGADGRLYCTVYNQKNVTVLDREGKVADRLILDGPQPTNCAFALDEKKLRVTEVGKGQVEELEVPCAGLPLHLPRFA
ncbi:SMP-30/gluconolactonase/LRE family protein [Bradyrhizobium jicamae]|uniref:SMP-30/gluconolactonase/LRE family protein n=1 Tax=Bradyrhizobium jicamae TaxID=280332 RepID=UPI001BAB22FA|nr:SMP-30/gluconolactonase/LRE family protein [Bradyrhizobium jicamae]MBR0939059.1 SMP-30/gluconolactonase/LRE family protein [Bradyrhizobium jicamae]